MRINKFIASALGYSRREVDEMISHYRIMINGKPAKLGDTVDSNDKVTLDDSIVKMKDSEFTYIAMYKPKHVVTTRSDEKHRDTITALLPEKLKGLKPAGRLDFETEGLVIMTDDGDFINYLTHPGSKVVKRYSATVFGNVSKSEIDRMKAGMLIQGEKYILDNVTVTHYNESADKSKVEIELTHGKKHEIRNVMKAMGHPVIKLKRMSIGNVTIRGMKPGTFVYFSREEFKKNV